MEKFRPHKKTALVVLGVVILLAVAAAAGVAVRQLTAPDKGPSSGAPKDPRPESVKKADALRFSGDTAGAAKTVEQALNDSNVSDADRYMLYVQQGNLYSDAKNYTAAAESYGNAEKIDATYEVTTLLAEAWLFAGNRAKAVEYYRKAIPLVPDSPVQAAEKKRLEDRLQAIEKGEESKGGEL